MKKKHSELYKTVLFWYQGLPWDLEWTVANINSAVCELCPRWELPGPSLHQLPAGAEGQPVQPLVLQQGLLPLVPRRTTSDLLVQEKHRRREEMGTFVSTCSFYEPWEEAESRRKAENQRFLQYDFSVGSFQRLKEIAIFTHKRQLLLWDLCSFT